MGMIRKLVVLAGATEVARRYAMKNPEKVNKMADDAAHFINTRTDNKYRSQLDGARQKLRQVTRGSRP
jgi:hypothetical protein